MSKVQFLIYSQVTESDEDMYLYIIDKKHNCYDVNSDDTVQNTNSPAQVPIRFSSLPIDPSCKARYFYFDQSSDFSGRIWFSPSNNLFPSGGSVQPTRSGGLLFDFIEPTLNPGTSVNIDTTNVNQLGIPITIINPAQAQFPPPIQDPLIDLDQYFYPNALGILPGYSTQGLCQNFSQYIEDLDLGEFSSCIDNQNSVQWLVSPSDVLSESNPSPDLASCMDTMIDEFFNYYNSNTLEINYSGGQSLIESYKGRTTNVTAQGIDGNSYSYKVLQFTTGDKQYNIYYPYFNTNTTVPNLPPPPVWWKQSDLPPLPTTTSATAQVFACNGVFNDGVNQFPNAKPDAQILSDLENIVGALLNRGLVPGAMMNNLFVYNGEVTPVPPQPVTFTDNNPNSQTSLSGASLLYTPSKIPNGAYPASSLGTFTITGAIQFGSNVPQSFTNIISGYQFPVPSGSPSNYCQNMVVQLSSSNQPQFAFDFEDAVWGEAKPSFVGPVTVEYTPLSSVSTQATLSPIPSGIEVGMNVIDINSQSPAVVSVIDTTNNSFTIESTINQSINQSTTTTLLIGKFYPRADNGTAQGCWNAYAGFLHYNPPSPFISHQGYGFSYDDQGGYSSDITVNYNNSNQIGVYLGAIHLPGTFSTKTLKITVGSTQPWGNPTPDITVHFNLFSCNMRGPEWEIITPPSPGPDNPLKEYSWFFYPTSINYQINVQFSGCEDKIWYNYSGRQVLDKNNKPIKPSPDGYIHMLGNIDNMPYEISVSVPISIPEFDVKIP